MKNPIKNIIEKGKAKVNIYKKQVEEKKERQKFLNTVVPTKNVYSLSRKDTFNYNGNIIEYNKYEYFLIKENFEQGIPCTGIAIQLTGENMGKSYSYSKAKDKFFVYSDRELLSITTLENNNKVTYTQDKAKIENLYEASLSSTKKITSTIYSLNSDRDSTNQYSKNSHIEEYNHNQNLSEAQDNVSELFNAIDNSSEM